MCLWAQLPDLRKEKGPASPQSSPLNQEPSLQATGDIDQGSQQSGHRALESHHTLPCCVILAKALDPPGPFLLYGIESSSWGWRGVRTHST